jgi:membrane protein DedA with SNARE-associated domain
VQKDSTREREKQTVRRPHREGLREGRDEEDVTEHLSLLIVAGPPAANILGDALRWIESLFAQHGYLIMAVLIAGESAGLPLPGETSLFAGAVEAQRGVLDLPVVMAVAAIAAMVGDNVGYWVGNRLGRPALHRYGHFLRIRDRELALLDHYFTRHGAKTVFFGRWITVLRVAAALFAGASRMPWRTFVLWNALGSAAWAVGISLLGYYLWASIHAVSSVFGYVGIGLFVATLIGGFFVLRRMERRMIRNAELEQAAEDEAAGGEKPDGGP